MTNAVRESPDNPASPRAPDDLIRDLRAQLAAAEAAVTALRQENDELKAAQPLRQLPKLGSNSWVVTEGDEACALTQLRQENERLARDWHQAEARFCVAHQAEAENETCPCCEAVHQADLLAQLRQDLQALPRHRPEQCPKCGALYLIAHGIDRRCEGCGWEGEERDLEAWIRARDLADRLAREETK